MRYLFDTHAFLRMLIAQATHEGLHVVSRDAQLDAYAVSRVWD